MRFLSRVPRVLLCALALVAAPTAVGCSDDEGGGMMNEPDAGPQIAWVCGPVECGLDEACVYLPNRQVTELFAPGAPRRAVRGSYRCAPDIGCGIQDIIDCANALDACFDDGRDRNECMNEFTQCQNESQVRLVENYGCEGNRIGTCTQELPYELVESFELSPGGVPVDPRNPSGATPGIYVAPFAVCD